MRGCTWLQLAMATSFDVQVQAKSGGSLKYGTTRLGDYEITDDYRDD